jgi:hypothetical protein
MMARGSKSRLPMVLTLCALTMVTGAFAVHPASATTAGTTFHDYSIAGLHRSSGTQTYNIYTLAGKVAAVNAARLGLELSGFIQDEASGSGPAATSADPITPVFVLNSSLDGLTVTAPDVTVNQDTAAATQNEPVIAVDPNNPNRVVAGANDYVTRTWSCFVGSTPCSALGDGYSGTYFSNDGGATWCCVATDPSNIGTLIPGVEHLVAGPYDAGGDPALAFDSRGAVYFSGLGFDRSSPPNTVEVSRGTFNASGNLTWGSPSFVDQTTSPSIFNDKEWVASDSHASSPFRDRVYVSFTRFVFNAFTGAFVQSPIFFAFSSDGGATFSTPQSVVGNLIFDQGSRIVVGPDGTVYVFWESFNRFTLFNSVEMVKSTDGGVTWSKPVQVAPLADIARVQNTAFRLNSFPAADIAPDGTLYAVWSSEENNSATSYATDPTCFIFSSTLATIYAHCHAASFWSKSTDGGATWSTPELIFPALDAATRTAIGYPVAQLGGGTLSAPSPTPRVDTIFPSVAVSPDGRVYLSAYAADVESPWQTCAKPATPTAVGRINCLMLGPYINNARLDYAVADLSTGVSNIVTTHPINTRYQFGGGFIGDYTLIAVGSDDVFHAIWTDTNNIQTVVWWYGFQFVPTPVHQQDVVTDAGSF